MDLSFNEIKKLNKIDIKTLNYLNLLNNYISEGKLDFLTNYNFRIYKLILVKGINKLSFEYYNGFKELLISLEYPVEEINMIEILYNISFKGIQELEIIGFNNYNFLSLESLSNLEILNFREKLEDITIFNNIKFKNLKKIIFYGNKPILKGFSSLNIFPSIHMRSIEIKEINKNNYKCNLSFMSPEFQRTFIFNDLKFLKEPFLEEKILNNNSHVNIDIMQQILDNKENFDFFSYNEVINSFPIFKLLKAEILDIKYNHISNKYDCLTKFYHYEFKMHFVFDDMKFIFDNIFNDIKQVSLSNITFTNSIGITKSKFQKLETLILNNNIIESTEFLSEINNNKEFLSINSDSNICKSHLFDFIDNNKYVMHKIISKENKINIEYNRPFNFCIDIDKIGRVRSFINCREIYLNNLQLNDDDIKFLNNKDLLNLGKLNLDGNNITNLNILDYMQSLYIPQLSLKNNPIKSGIEKINHNNEYVLDSVEVKLKNEEHIISLKYSSKEYYSRIYFDYVYDVNKSLDIFKTFNFIYVDKLDLSGIILKNIDFMENNKSFQYIKNINYDNNLIDDINIFGRLNYYNHKISLRQNPIRKSLNLLRTNFFRAIYIDIDITKQENEYKVYVSFKHPYIDIEFFISNINEIKNILDFDNNYINLVKNNLEELKVLESELKINKSDEEKQFYEHIVSLVNFFKDNKKIIFSKKYNSEMIEGNCIYFNDNNKELLKKLLSHFKSRTAFYSSVSELNLLNFDEKDENIIPYLSFLYIDKLKISTCNFNYSILQNLKLKNLDISETFVSAVNTKEIIKLTSVIEGNEICLKDLGIYGIF